MMLRLGFAHPREFRVVWAEVELAMTPERIIHALTRGKFIEDNEEEGRFALAHPRTGVRLPEDGAIARAELRDGDVLQVVEVEAPRPSGGFLGRPVQRQLDPQHLKGGQPNNPAQGERS